MKSYYMQAGAGLEGLTLREEDTPKPARHQVLVQVKASSLNYRELMILKGKYPLPIKSALIPLCDGAGTVVEIGEEVTAIKVGDRVTGVVFPDWFDGPFSRENSRQLGGSLDGMLTEYALLEEKGVVQIPNHLTFEEAAAFPCAGVTAWNALTGGRGVVAGETVLTMGSGAVSLFALQFAKLAGLRVIATTSSPSKAQMLSNLGADQVINYRETPDWHEQVKAFTHGQGVDHVIEVGGAGTLERSLQSLHLTGEISLVGWLDSQATYVDLTVFGATVAAIRRIAVGSKAQNIAMNRAVAVHQLKPVIDQVFHFSEAKAAFNHYASGDYFGKTVIRHD